MIETLPEMQLQAGDEVRIAALLAQSFPTDFAGRSFYQQRPSERLIWREAQILGHIALHFRAIRLGDALIDIVGLSDVAVCSSARGRGIATDLLAHSITRARTSRAAFVMLFGQRGLYDRAGFRQVPNRHRFTPLIGARTGQTTTETSRFLHILALGPRPWSDSAELDLLGHIF